MRRIKYIRRYLFAVLGLLLLLPAPVAFAVCPNNAQSCSGHYQVNQTTFSSGGTDQNACSTGPTGYCSKQTAGDLSIGNACSTSYCAWAGFNTTDDPFLEFVVTASNIDLGYLDTTHVSTATGTFSIRAWESGGYVVRTESDPPTNTGPNHQQLAALASPTASSPGTEQFGINLVKNTNFCGAGCNLGADPQQMPNSSFAFGQVEPNYANVNQFKYAKHDPIAFSSKSTSVTAYTISYIFNISNATPSGQYTFNHVLVATATY